MLAASASAQSAVVTGQDAFLRGTPVENGAVVDTLAVNSRVHIIKQTGDWYLVQSFPFVGWIHGSLLRVENDNEAVKASMEVGADQSADRTESQTKKAPIAGEKIYKKGPRGGCYYVNEAGKKIYVTHRRCDNLDTPKANRP